MPADGPGVPVDEVGVPVDSPGVPADEVVAPDVDAGLVDVALEGAGAVEGALAAVPPDCACAVASLAVSDDSNAVESGAWMLAAALAAVACPASTKRIDVGPGMTIPSRVARLSMRWLSDSDETLARRSSLRL